MGAQTFTTTGVGITPNEAFVDAVASARYESGSEGYTGTIAEKDSFKMIDVPENENPYKHAAYLIDKNDQRVAYKDGPAGCIELGPAPEGYKPDGARRFLFFGWAKT